MSLCDDGRSHIYIINILPTELNFDQAPSEGLSASSRALLDPFDTLWCVEADIVPVITELNSHERNL